MNGTNPLIRPAGPQLVKDTAKPRADADDAAIGALFGAILFPPAGIILGHVSRGQARRRGLRPSVPASMGCILGYALTILVITGIILLIAAMARTGPPPLPCEAGANPHYPWC